MQKMSGRFSREMFSEIKYCYEQFIWNYLVQVQQLNNVSKI